jgi:hypothetical protein
MDRTILDDLHDSVAKDLLAKVKSGEATASELSVATKFLKDNGAVHELITSESPLRGLLEALPFEDQGVAH